MAYRDYIIQRGASYCFRIRVPSRHRAALGRAEIRRALGSDERTARTKALRMAWITLKVFESMDANRTQLTPQEITNLLDDWYRRMVDRDREITRAIEVGMGETDMGTYQEQAEQASFLLGDLLEQIVDRGREPSRPENDQPKPPTEAARQQAMEQATRWLQSMGADLDSVPVWSSEPPALEQMNEASKRQLLAAFLKTAVRAFGDRPGGRVEPPTPSSPVATSGPPKPRGPRFTALWEAYVNDMCRERGTWKVKVPDFVRQGCEDFQFVLGDPHVDQITREDCEKFRDFMECRPKRTLMRKGREYEGYSATEILQLRDEIEEEDQLRGGGPRENVNAVVAYLQWLVDRGTLDRHPAPGLKTAVREPIRTLPWLPDEIAKLLDEQSLYDRGGYKTNKMENPSFPLVLVLLLYMGARREEVCYLRAEDFIPNDPHSEGDIPCVMIVPTMARRLKNKNSKRKVPLHPDLEALGVIDYFKQRQERGKEYLLDITEKGGSRGKAITQIFSRYAGRLGFPRDRTKPLHALRKSLSNQATGVMIDDDKKRMTGHGPGDVHDRVYANDLLRQPQDRTYEGLSKVDFGLDLEALRATLGRFVPDFLQRKINDLH